MAFNMVPLWHKRILKAESQYYASHNLSAVPFYLSRFIWIKIGRAKSFDFLIGVHIAIR